MEPLSAQASFAETQIAIVNDGLGTVLAKTCDSTNPSKAPHSGHEQESGTIVASNAANDNVRWTDQNCCSIVPRESYTLGGYLFSIASAPEAVSEAADPSGNRLQALVAATTAEGSTTQCTADGEWCIAIEAEEQDAVAVVRARRADATTRVQLAHVPEGSDYDRTNASIWPFIVRLSGRGVMFGIIGTDRIMYSGGGAYNSILSIYRLQAGEAPHLAAELDWNAGGLIRACFSEQDHRDRRGACHFEYDYSANLTLAPEGGPNAPAFRYRVISTSFPGTASRNEGWISGKRLLKRDLARVTDPTCSFTRLLKISSETATYAFNEPLPDCSDFRSL